MKTPEEIKKIKEKKIAILKNKARNSTSKKTRRKIGRAIANLEIKSKDTKPELRTEKLLQSLGVKYEKHVVFHGFEYDFLLPEYKIFIECNGGYYHSSPLKYKASARNSMQRKNYRRDNIKMNVAISNNYRVLYIWEDDINKLTSKVRDDIVNLLKEDKEWERGHRHALEEIFSPYVGFYKLIKG